MTRARATLVSVQDAPYYHCIGRCVRRAFLCGFDAQSQTSFEHRRGWMQERLALLTDAFAIELCAYALDVESLSSSSQTFAGPQEERVRPRGH
jgi:putative transposase